MTKLEVKELIDLIVIHRPFFKSRLGDSVYQDMLNEWTRIMGPYDFEDIRNNLENFLKDERNYGKDPDAYQLIRGLLTTEDKKTNSLGRVACQFCGRWFNRLELADHEDRCRSVKYLKRVYKKYLNSNLNVSKELYEMNQEEFDKRYINTLEKALPRVTDILDKRGMTNVIETYYGREPKYTFEEVVGKDLI